MSTYWAGCSKMWVDGELVYDAAAGIDLIGVGFERRFTFYPDAETTPDGAFVYPRFPEADHS